MDLFLYHELYKVKNTISARCLGVSRKHMFLLAFLLTLGPVVWHFVSIGISQTLDAVYVGVTHVQH